MKKVILLVENDRGFGRELMRGIARYAALQGPWTFYHLRVFYLDKTGRITNTELSRIRNWGPDGIIAREFTENTRNIVHSLGIPGILSTIFNEEPEKDLGHIFVDNVKVGEMASIHLLERGFRHFAFCGLDDFFWSWRRFEGFKNVLDKAGYTPYLYRQPKTKADRLWDNEQKILEKWVQGLPKPLGLMCCIDERSQDVIAACSNIGISMPEEVAVIGGDNDELMCELSNPQLSSVAVNGFQAGYKAAELLDHMMQGKNPSNLTVRVSPTHVVTRHSTDIFAVEDEVVSQALRYIRSRVNEPIQVEDVAREVAVTRQGLNKKFRRYLGRTVHMEINKVRVDYIARQLIETNLPIGHISEKLLFTDAKHLSRVFARLKGVSPTHYRRRFQ